jgi:hypothetical protein
MKPFKLAYLAYFGRLWFFVIAELAGAFFFFTFIAIWAVLEYFFK